MAKNTRKKAKKPAAPAKKKSTAKKSAGMKSPSSITTGRGPGPAEIGDDLVAMFNQGKMQEIEAKWYSPKIVSIEGIGVALAWHGKKALQEKSKEWAATHKIHGASAEGPYLGASGFAVKYAVDVEDTAANCRNMMEEVGVYTVQNGKIVREEFMYGKKTPIVQAGGSGNG